MWSCHQPRHQRSLWAQQETTGCTTPWSPFCPIQHVFETIERVVRISPPDSKGICIAKPPHGCAVSRHGAWQPIYGPCGNHSMLVARWQVAWRASILSLSVSWLQTFLSYCIMMPQQAAHIGCAAAGCTKTKYPEEGTCRHLQPTKLVQPRCCNGTAVTTLDLAAGWLHNPVHALAVAWPGPT